jgi:hypothetical protein
LTRITTPLHFRENQAYSAPMMQQCLRVSLCLPCPGSPGFRDLSSDVQEGIIHSLLHCRSMEQIRKCRTVNQSSALALCKYIFLRFNVFGNFLRGAHKSGPLMRGPLILQDNNRHSTATANF